MALPAAAAGAAGASIRDRLAAAQMAVEGLKVQLEQRKRFLASGGLAAAVQERGAPLRQLGAAPHLAATLEGHSNKVYALDWTGNEERLVSARCVRAARKCSAGVAAVVAAGAQALQQACRRRCCRRCRRRCRRRRRRRRRRVVAAAAFACPRHHVLCVATAADSSPSRPPFIARAPSSAPPNCPATRAAKRGGSWSGTRAHSASCAPSRSSPRGS